MAAMRDALTGAASVADEARLTTVVSTATRLADGAHLPSAWSPPRGVEALEQDALERRAAVQPARAQARAASARVELLRRERIPDVTFGASYAPLRIHVSPLFCSGTSATTRPKMGRRPCLSCHSRQYV
jgi:outer membrane protein TolC